MLIKIEVTTDNHMGMTRAGGSDDEVKPPVQGVLGKTEPLPIPPELPDPFPSSRQHRQPIPPLLPPLQRKGVPPVLKTGHMRDKARGTGGQDRGVEGEGNLVGRGDFKTAASWHLAGLTWAGEAVLPPQL